MIQKEMVKQAVMPYVALAMIVALAIVGFVLFSTLLVLCATVGFVIYIIASIRLYFIKRRFDKRGQSQHTPVVIDVPFTKRQDD